MKGASVTRIRATKTTHPEEIAYPLVVRKGSVQVTIYRINNPARGEVFEVTWFKEGQRTRKTFRDSTKAREHAAATVKALDSGKGDSMALSGTELEGFRLAKRTLSSLETPPPPRHRQKQILDVVDALLHAPATGRVHS